MATDLATLAAPYLAFLPSQNGTRNVAFPNTPSGFVDGSAESAELSGQYTLSSLTDDNITVAVRVQTSGGTILAADDSGGTYHTIVNLSGTAGGTALTLTPFNFPYIKTTATKTEWDDAHLYVVQTYSNNMGGDGGYFQHNFVDTGLILTLRSSTNLVVGDTESLTLTGNPATVSKIYTADLDFTAANSGDTLLAFIAMSQDASQSTPPAGWTFVQFNRFINNVPVVRVEVYKKVATGSETIETFGGLNVIAGFPVISPDAVYADITTSAQLINYGGSYSSTFSLSTAVPSTDSEFYTLSVVAEAGAVPVPAFSYGANETLIGTGTAGQQRHLLTKRVIDFATTSKVWAAGPGIGYIDYDNSATGTLNDGLLKGGAGGTLRTQTWNGVTVTDTANSSQNFRSSQVAGTTLAGVVSCDQSTGNNNTEEWNGSSWANVNTTPVGSSSGAHMVGTQVNALWKAKNSLLTYVYNGTTYTNQSASSSLAHTAGSMSGSPSDALIVGANNVSTVDATSEEWSGTVWSAGGTMPATGRSFANGVLMGNATSGLHTGGGAGNFPYGVDLDYNGTTWSVGGSPLHAITRMGGCGSPSGGGFTSGGRDQTFSHQSFLDLLDDHGGGSLPSNVTGHLIAPSTFHWATSLGVVVPIEGPVIIQPPPGAISFSGEKPIFQTVAVVDHERVAAPPAGRITLLADAPIFDNTQDGVLENIVYGDTEFLTLTGNPAVIPVVAPTESLTLTGTPAVVDQRFRRDVAGVTESLTLTGNAATVQKIPQTNRFVVGDTESLTLTGNPATIVTDRIVSGATESLTLTGNRPTIPLVGETESLTLTGNVAAVYTDRVVQGVAESLTLTGNPATLTKDLNLVLPTESLTLTGNPATLTKDRTLVLATEFLSLTANTATLVRVIKGTTAGLALTGTPAVVDQDRLVGGVTQALTLAANPAIVDQDRVIRGSTGALALTTNPAAIGQGQTARGDVAELTLTSAPAVIKRGLTARPNTEILRLNGQKAKINQGRNVRGTSAGLVITAFGSVFQQRRVRLTTEFLTLVANSAAIGRGRTVRCGTHTILLASESAFVGRGKTVRPATANNLLTANAVNIGQLIRGQIFCETERLLLTARPAYVQRMTIDDPLLSYKRVGVICLGVDAGANPLPTYKDGVNVISKSGAELSPDNPDVVIRGK